MTTTSLILKENSNNTKNPAYPVMKQHVNDLELIVLFIGIGTGFIVNKPEDGVYYLGFCSEQWRESMFQIFNGQILLENS